MPERNIKKYENPIFTVFGGILKKIKGHVELYTVVSMTVGCSKMHAKIYIMHNHQNYVHWKYAFIFLRVTTQNRSLRNVNHRTLPVASVLNIGFPNVTTEIYDSYQLDFLVSNLV